MMIRQMLPVLTKINGSYTTPKKISENAIISPKNLKKLRQLVGLWWAEAGKYNVSTR
ncbi:MAG TPA: hypothetical protein VEH06_04200 [Candidatus Bathyarchaeia archaeon]|nr:hypothetical protein [Candidatus Bathyarchaeia archaeon]